MENLAWFKKGEFWVTKKIEDQPSFSWGNGLTKKSKDFSGNRRLPEQLEAE